ncbi:MAG: hypothetical protein N4A72_03985 [Bacteroidales bacterium]|jgi:hypothetical protein|nr:hypothetical protein [Bacteroidales bacterium]
MSKFNCCYRYLINSDVSHAWIHLHRCIEAYSGTTGETFSSIFARIEAKFNIDRRDKNRWPNKEQIYSIAQYLKNEREHYLRITNKLIKERQLEKRQGKRITTNAEFLNIMHKQTKNSKQKVGYWGWRNRRKVNENINTM